ncbi:ACT domain-containing protein, partial [Candidatus Entotheonella palauensis]
IAKVSIVGVGMQSHSGVASRMFEALAAENINILMISTSEIKVSCIIQDRYAELALRTLHDAFELGERP